MDFKKLMGILLSFPLLAQGQEADSAKRLQEVEIIEKQESNFGHMYQVDGMKIAAGKKTEVINVELLNVNKSTNNTRQVYAKVAGLNIFENDGSGLQLSIGGRGLDPNRTSNFNVRQNGYDISADALGYPESYYTPPADALKKIEIIKGAASLQYGTQFGGLLNFEMKQPEDSKKKLIIESKQTVGSFGFLGSFNSVGGTNGKLSYYAYAHYKRGDGWRPNSAFESFNAYADLHYHINERHMVGIEFSHLQYLSQQPGGLTDDMFRRYPRQSNRSRNWFAVNWDLLDLEWDYQISSQTRLQTRAYGLIASRNAIGFRPNRPAQHDAGGERDLLKGTFQNLTLESRFLHRYSVGRKNFTLLTGVRAYKGYSTSKQGDVVNGSGADFEFPEESTLLKSDYEFPNINYAWFAEHIFRINDKWNITPGVRVEHIETNADGVFHDLDRHPNTQEIIGDSIVYEQKSLPRTFVIGGIGSSYKIKPGLEFYGNVSQNYRSVTFSDIQIVNPSFEIDPAIEDERGYSADLGIRGNLKNLVRFDGNLFFMHYGNRIGEYEAKKKYQNSGSNSTYVIRRRANVGVADIYGLETFVEADILSTLAPSEDHWGASIYSNLTLTKASYTRSTNHSVVGKRVEYVPQVNWKGGLQASYQRFKLTWQISHLSEQFTDATNARESDHSAVNGVVPAYTVMDLTIGWSWRWLTVEGSVNNLANSAYFTRRATGYPGPGIIPGEGRSFYLTVGYRTP